MTTILGNARTTASIITALQFLVQHADADRWRSDFYTDVVWNVGRNDNIDFDAVRDGWQDFERTIGLRELLDAYGWTVVMDVCHEDDTPLRLRMLRTGPQSYPIDRDELDDIADDIQTGALRMMVRDRRQSALNVTG